ncbi:hypothetical protein SKAU_G00083510 [Synaphobranchus kaupii]|uniref:C2H2-type domain-containing protein n=1 Tax=Synaphobranchus kaupii TaxID=118154 RepID=A0A9Q1FW42_SYNKA|nr:hypothetical protein SKAU_G00083510 [Synaphobranchus kaupii]
MNQTSVSGQTFFTTTEEDTVKEEQMELACDQCHAGLHGNAEESHVEDQNERHTRSTETQTLTNDGYKGLVQPALEKGEYQVHPVGEGSTGKGELVVHGPTSSPVAAPIARDVTELGSVCLVEDLCSGTPVKNKCSEETGLVGAYSGTRSDSACRSSSSEDFTLNAETRMTECSRPLHCSVPSAEEEHLPDQHGLSHFERLRAQLLSGKASDASQGSTDCKLCGRSFCLQETLRIHQLLHRMDGVCSCAVCGRTAEAGCPSRRDPYRCDDCGKNFAHQRSLKRHQRMHQVGPLCADG